MHSEESIHSDRAVVSSRLPALSFIAAGLAIICALLSLFVSSHRSVLYTQSMTALHRQTSSESSSLKQLQTAHDTLAAELDAARQALENEKAGAGKLRRQLADVTKEFEQIKKQLADADKKIESQKAALRTKVPVAPPASPSGDTSQPPHSSAPADAVSEKATSTETVPPPPTPQTGETRETPLPAAQPAPDAAMSAVPMEQTPAPTPASSGN